MLGCGNLAFVVCVLKNVLWKNKCKVLPWTCYKFKVKERLFTVEDWHSLLWSKAYIIESGDHIIGSVAHLIRSDDHIIESCNHILRLCFEKCFMEK